MIGGAESLVVVLGASENAPAALREHWPASQPPSAPLSATLEATLSRGQLSLQEPSSDLDAWEAVAHVAVPILRGGAVCGGVGVSVRGAVAGEAKTIAERLAVGVQLLEKLLDSHDEFSRVRDMLGVCTALLEHERLAPASHELATALAHQLGCERVALGVRRGSRVRVVALSNAIRFSPRSEGLRELRAAMGEAIDQDATLILPERDDDAALATESHEALLAGSGAGAACTLPLAAQGRAVGAVTFEWPAAERPDDETLARVGILAGLAGPILKLLARADAGPLERAGSAWRRTADRVFGGQSLARVAVVAAALLVALLAFVPGAYRVSGPASLEGRLQRALVAAVPGYLAEAHARAGDLVSAGDVLARLDDRDLQLEAQRWQSQRAQLEREYREALARQDRARVSILRARIDQAAAQQGLAEEALGRTEVVAPFDGIVLEGDLDRSLGSPVEQGSVLFEIAPLDGYRIIVEVDGRDIADVAVGQPGRLTLSALPDETLPLTVERITPLSTVRDGRNHFRVEASLTEPRAALRPGMEGVAKIDAGRRRLLWIWTHELFDWLRLQLWSLLP